MTSLQVLVVYVYSLVVYRQPINEDTYQRFLTGHIWISCITGLIWSGFAIVQLDADSLITRTVASTIVTSITLGGMFPSSAYRATYLGLLTCCILPLALYWVVVVPNPLRFYGFGFVLYYIFGLVASARTEINMRDLLLAEQSKQLADELKQRNEFVESLNREKTEFMVATVHDFSQPLHAQGYFIEA